MSLPAPTHELNGNAGITRDSGDPTKVTAWGTASALVADAPTYSDDSDDLILGYPVVRGNGSNQFMQWNAIAAMFSGDDPDFSLAMTLRVNATGGNFLCCGNDSQGEVRVGVNSSPNFFQSRIDDANISNTGGLATATTDEYLLLVKCASNLGSVYSYRLSDGAESSGTGTINRPSITMLYGALFSRIEGNVDAGHAQVDIARVRLYDSALIGDLTADFSDFQFGGVKTEMLQNLGDNDLLTRMNYGVGLGLGLGTG